MQGLGLGLVAFWIGASGPALAADMATYYHAGSWDAFSGRADGGELVCGVGYTSSADGRRLALHFTIGGDDVTFTASKPDWTIPADTRVPVVMQIGLETPWTRQGAGSDHGLSWTLDRAATQSFDAQFRRADSMTITFPAGNEPPWIVPLAGSTAISDAFGRCITDLTQRSAAQAAGPASAAPQGPTQPFGTTPAASTHPDAQR